MSKDETEIEALIQAKGLTRPRLTPQEVDDTIKAETYTTLPSGKVMVCELTLRNGFTVRGEAAVVSKANFNEDVGRKISRENARNKVWELEGYLLQQRLYDDLLEAVKTERHACSICVWMVLQDELEPGADDKGLEGWMREAEQRVKNRLAHHRTEAPLPQPTPGAGFCWLVEEFGPEGNSTGRYMLDQGALTTTTDVHAAKKLRRWQSAGLRALDMKAQHKGDWRAIEHGFGVGKP